MMLIKGPVPPLTEERIGLCGHGSLGAVLFEPHDDDVKDGLRKRPK